MCVLRPGFRVRAMQLRVDMTDPSQRLDEYIAAFRTELGAAQRHGATRRVDLDDGRVTQAGQTNSVLVFANPGTVTLQEDDEVKLTLRAKTYDATVLGVSPSELAFSVPAHIAGDVDTATLDFAAGFLYHAIIARLERIRDEGPEDFFDPAIGDWVAHGDVARYGDASLSVDSFLNEGQADAVRTMHRSRSSFLWGPPGTGKSFTVAVAVRDMVRRGLSVLIASTTNAAVDAVALKVADLLHGDGKLMAGVMLRDGFPTPQVEDAYGGILARGGALAALGHDERELLRDVDKAIEQATRQQSRFHHRGSRYGAYTEQWRERLVALTDDRAALAALADDVDERLISSASVVATTVHRVATAAVRRRFDAVVIDEASMISMPLAWLAAGQARRHVVAAGDFRQLGPIVKTDDPAAAEILKTSPFEESGVADRERRTARTVFTGLTEQYRMTGAVNDLVSRHFYPDSPLTVAPAIRTREPLRALPDLPPLVRVDVSGHRMWAGRSLGERSRYNLANAQIVHALATLMRRAHQAPRDLDLIAISPYRAQATILRAALDEVLSVADGALGRTRASTVHSYQGGEACTVIVDLTDGYGTEVGPFYSGSTLGSDTSRLINVAFSRAKDQIIVIGDFSRVRGKTPAGSPVAKALDTMRATASALTVEAIASRLECGAPFSVAANGPGERALDDIADAERNVTVFSQWIGKRMRPYVESALQSALSNGASVRIVMGPRERAGLQDGQPRPLLEWATAMREAGITVDLRHTSGGYETAVIADDIVWTGRNVDSDGLFGDRPCPAGFRSVSAALATEATQHLGRRAPRGARFESGTESAPCPDCGRPMAFADVYRATYLYCPYCEPGRAPGSRTATRGSGSTKTVHHSPSQPEPQAFIDVPIVQEVRGYLEQHAIPASDITRMTCPSCGRVMNRDGRCLCVR